MSGQRGPESSWVGVRPLLSFLPSSFLLTDKLWFCCLSPNHKVLQYGDVEEGASPPTLESLPEQRKEDGAGGRVSHLPSPGHTCPGTAWVPEVSPAFFLQSLWPISRHC